MKEISLDKTPKQTKPSTVTSKTTKPSLISKIITIFCNDITNLFFRKKQTNQEWEDYKRFCELARKK